MEDRIHSIDTSDDELSKIKELRQIVGTASKELLDLLFLMIENESEVLKIEALKVLADLEYDILREETLVFLENIICESDNDEIRHYALRSFEFIMDDRNLDFIYAIAANKNETNILRWYAFTTIISSNYDKAKIAALEEELKALK